MSDPETPDAKRRGVDLLERIGELTAGVTVDPDDGLSGNGWRFLLQACGREISAVQAERDELRNILCRMDAFLDFGTPFEISDLGILDPNGLNAACELARAALAKLERVQAAG